MPYKGEDLDLRVPYARGGRDRLALDRESAGRWTRFASTTMADEPIWVDEVVLLCCNYAFEVAASHHHREVGLEHLVHALTRVDAAARILEVRGVREVQLRRDSGSLLTSDSAPKAGGEAMPPRRSPGLEEVLRRACDRARRRDDAAGIDDLLWSLLHFPGESAAVALLRRMTPDWQRSDWSRQPEFAPTDLRVLEAPRMATISSQRDGLPARLADLEEAIRHVHVELTSERRAFLDLLRDLHRDVLSQRGDQASFRGDMAIRLDAIERTLEMRSESPRSPAVAERMHALEKAVHGGLGEGARNWALLGQKMQAFDLVTERLETIERSLEKRSEDGGRRWSELLERLEGIEAAGQLGAPSSAGASPLIERLDGLERVVRSGFGETARIATEASAAADQQKVSGEEALLMLDERLGGLERLIAERQPQAAHDVATQLVRATAPIGDRVSGLEQQIAKRSEETAALLRETSERLLAREQAVSIAGQNAEAELQARDREVRELHDAIVRLAENQHTLASAVSDWRHEVQTDLGAINTRIERLVTVVAQPSHTPLSRLWSLRTRRARARTQPPPIPSDIIPGLIDEPRDRFARWRLGSVRTWLKPSERLTRVNQEARQRLKRLQEQIKAVRIRRR